MALFHSQTATSYYDKANYLKLRFYLRRFSESRSSSWSTASVRPFVCPSVRLFVCPSGRLSATLLGCLICVICNSNSFHSFIFKLCLMNLDIFLSEKHSWCQVCVICNSQSFHSFIFKLCIMIVHALKMCTFYFCAHLINIFTFLWVLNLDIFPSEMHRGCQVCVNCNSNSFHFFIFKLCIMIVHTLKYVHLLFRAHLINIFTFLRVLNLGIFSRLKWVGVSGLCNQ